MCITIAPLVRTVLSPKFQLNEYGVVPPVAVAVKVTGLLTVGLLLTVNDTATGSAAMDTLALFEARAPLLSVAVTLIV